MNKRNLLSIILSLIFTALGVVTITFFVLHLAPGDPALMMLGDTATAEAIEAMYERLGLNKPLFTQYLIYMKQVFTGDLGYSISTGVPVIELIRQMFPYTLILTAYSVLVAILVGVPLGILSAINHNNAFDRIISVLSLAGVSLPIFVIGYIFLLFLGIRYELFPIIGSGELSDWKSILYHTTLPAFTLGLSSAAQIAKITRSSMLEMMGADFVRTARSKGMKERIVILKHVLRSAAVAIVTMISMQFSSLLGGSVVTESVFARQGLGKLMVNGIQIRDYPLVQGIILVFSLIVVLINVLTDLLLSLLDPRYR